VVERDAQWYQRAECPVTLTRLLHLLSKGDILRVSWLNGRRCSRDTYPESYITKYTSIRRKSSVGDGHAL